MALTIEERLARLEAVKDIKALKARYCALCDANYEPERLATLFLPDAVWESELSGRYEGREAILRSSAVSAEVSASRRIWC